MDVLGIIIIAPIFIALIVGVGMAYVHISSELSDAQDSSIGDIPAFNESANIPIALGNKYANFWDYLLILTIIGIFMIGVIMSYLLGNNPIFLAVYVVLSFILVIASIVITGAMKFWKDNIVMSQYLIDYPITSFYIEYMLYFNIFYIGLMAIALYLKR